MAGRSATPSCCSATTRSRSPASSEGPSRASGHLGRRVAGIGRLSSSPSPECARARPRCQLLRHDRLGHDGCGFDGLVGARIGAGARRCGVRAARRHAAVGRARRGRLLRRAARRHVPGEARAGSSRGLHPAAPRWARHRRHAAVLRPPRPRGRRRRRGAARRPLLRRAHLGHRRGPGPARDRLACPRRGALLPGHRHRADGDRPAPALPDQRPPPRWSRRRGVRPRRRRRRRLHRGRRGCAPRRARTWAYGADARHRRHHPGGAGRSDPCAAPWRADRLGRARHRQDGRRPAPCGLPALHVPPAARVPGRAPGGAQPDLPALHRRSAARARRGRSHARGAGVAQASAHGARHRGAGRRGAQG